MGPPQLQPQPQPSPKLPKQVGLFQSDLLTASLVGRPLETRGTGWKGALSSKAGDDFATCFSAQAKGPAKTAKHLGSRIEEALLGALHTCTQGHTQLHPEAGGAIPLTAGLGIGTQKRPARG